MEKIDVKTFQNLNKPIEPSKGKQALKTINLDGQVYSRLLVVSKNRDIELKEVQSYELASVLLALANMHGSLRKPTKSTLLKEQEMDIIAKSTLPAYSLHQTAYKIDILAVIQMLSKKKLKLSVSFLTQLQQLSLLKFQFSPD